MSKFIEEPVMSRIEQTRDRMSQDEYDALIAAVLREVSPPHSFAYMDDLDELIARRGVIGGMAVA